MGIKKASELGQLQASVRLAIGSAHRDWAGVHAPGRVGAEAREDVAEVLGHSSTQVTLDVCSHVDAGMQADATSRVAGLFGSRDTVVDADPIRFTAIAREPLRRLVSEGGRVDQRHAISLMRTISLAS
jgi:hypothetical protein